MTVENVKVIVESVIDVTIENKSRANRVKASIEEKGGALIVYLSHGATLGEACDIQDRIKACGLDIPAQIGNAAIYVTM